MITGQGITFAYDRAAVLDNVEVAATRSEVVGLIGPNGSGKSTLLRTLYGALQPQAGYVLLGDMRIEELGARDIAQRVAVVVQESDSELPFTVTDIVLLGRTPHMRSFQRHSKKDLQIAADAIHRVGVRHLADRVFAGLSGGEKQRVLIARALAQGASHLLLDEPTNHLDIRYQHAILNTVRELDLTTIVVLHDLNLAARYCDRLLLLREGRVVADGPPETVLTPEVIEPVYGITVERIDHAGRPQLIFTLDIAGSAP